MSEEQENQNEEIPNQEPETEPTEQSPEEIPVDKIRNVSEASDRAREELVRMNGITGVIMLQFEAINLVDYKNKPTWKVKCSFLTDLAGTTRVKKELFIDKVTGEVVLMNGNQ